MRADVFGRRVVSTGALQFWAEEAALDVDMGDGHTTPVAGDFTLIGPLEQFMLVAVSIKPSGVQVRS